MLNFCGEARSHLIYLSIAFNQSNGICCFRSVSAYNHRIFRTFSQHACTVAGVCMSFSPAFSLKVNLPFLFGFYLNIFPFDTVPRTFFFVPWWCGFYFGHYIFCCCCSCYCCLCVFLLNRIHFVHGILRNVTEWFVIVSR